MNSNILYDETTDNLYILIYKLGSGACATVWFAINYVNFLSLVNTLKVNICAKALKIHNSRDWDEGILETKIKDLVKSDQPDSKYINFPTSHFIHNEDIVVVVYEVCVGSLYDVMKIYNKKLPIEFIEKITLQMTSSIKFIHSHNYIHTDIKPENFLLVGITQLQSDIIDWVKKYNLIEKFKLSKKRSLNKKNMFDVITEPIYNMINYLTEKFELIDNIANNEDFVSNTDSDSENSTSSTKSSKSYKSTKSKSNISNFESKYSSKLSVNSEYSNSTYNSSSGEYSHFYDKFNIKKIRKIEEINNDTHFFLNSETDNYKQIEQYLINPQILLTDFGLMKKMNSPCVTIQSRYYRSPEVILGLTYNKQVDLWAYGCTLYELITGNILINVEKEEFAYKYDKDLINVKLLVEKICVNYDDFITLAKKSNRKNYIFNDNYTLKYFTKIKQNNWKEEPEFKLLISGHNSIIELMERLLKILPQDRTF